MYDFKKKAQETLGNGRKYVDGLLKDKTIIPTNTLLTKYPDGVHVIAADIVNTKNGQCAAINFSEDLNAVYFGGTVLTQYIESTLDDFDGDAVALSNELQDANTVFKFTLRESKKSGNEYVALEVL